MWSYHIITAGYSSGIFIRILIFYQFGGHIATYIKGVFSSGRWFFSHKTLLFLFAFLANCITMPEVSSDACLQYFDTTKLVTLQVDALQVGLGAVVTQKDSQGRSRPVAFVSKSLMPAGPR